MEDERDFERVKGKISRHDYEGHDITGDNLSAGARRRDDDTLSRFAYDLEFSDHDEEASSSNEDAQKVPPEVLALLLEKNPALLDEETSAELVKLFGGGRSVDGQCVPVRSERVEETLRLTDGDMQSSQD